MLNLDDLVTKIRFDDSEVPPAVARTDAALGKLGSAIPPVHRQFGELGKSSKLTRQELLTLNYTVNDVIASLASGASPFTILAQQGGQVTQAFGGVGQTFSKLGAAITVGRVAVAGMAAALGTLAFAYVDGMRESDAFEKAVNRTGNAAGLTEDRFRSLTREVAAASGATVGASREVVSALIATGQFGPRALGEVATAAAAMAKAYDLSAESVVKDFAGMSGGVAKWAAEHNKSMNFITVEQYRYIRALEEQGRVSEAQIYTSRKVIEASERVTKNLGSLERGWERVKNMASWAWDVMRGVGRAETTADQLANLQQDLATRTARGPLNDLTRGSFEKGNEKLRQDIYLLQEKLRLEQRSVAAQAASAEANRKAIADERAREGKTKREPRDFFNEAQDRLEERIRVGLDRVADSEEQAALQQQRREEKDYARRYEQAAEFGQQLAEQAAGINASLIADDRARAEAQIAIERASITSRIEAMGLVPEQAAALQGRAAEYILARERQLTEQLKPEIDRRLELYADFNRYAQIKSAEFRDGFVEEGRAAFYEWVETGKLSADQLARYIQRRLAESLYDRFLAGGIDSLGSAIFGGLTGLLGSGLSIDPYGIGITSGNTGLVDLGLGAGRARGGDVKRGMLYPINEEGTPEVLSVSGGGDYLMTGRRSGRVTPMDRWQQGGRGGDTYLTVAPVFQGNGVDRNELMSGMALAVDMAVARVADHRARGNALFRD